MYNRIVFSPELIEYLPLYLGTTLKDISNRPDFKYSLQYLSNSVNGYCQIAEPLQEELNKLWNKLGLDNTDLQNIYQLINLVETGSYKYKS